jgi:rare lipoprotein A
MRNGKTVKVRINDRGPFVRGRVIDVSRRAAEKLGMLKAGVVPVRLKVIRRGSG